MSAAGGRWEAQLWAFLPRLEAAGKPLKEAVASDAEEAAAAILAGCTMEAALCSVLRALLGQPLASQAEMLGIIAGG
jgi:hypothetical protein